MTSVAWPIVTFQTPKEEYAPSTSTSSDRSASSSPEAVDDQQAASATASSRNVCPSTCAVCGDTATGYHYDVASCNGCKTFFRRTLLAKRVYECRKGGRCFEILPKERRCSCRACRFQQCVAVGMNPLAIQMEGRPEDNYVIASILQRKRPAEQKLALPSHAVTREDDFVMKLIESLEYLEIKSEKFRRCSYNPGCQELPSLCDVLRTSSALNLAEKCEPMPCWPLEPILITPERKEMWKKGLIQRNPYRKNWRIYDLLLTVEYAKTFSFFHRLSEKDQVTLLKGASLMCCNLMKAFYSYSNKSDTILYPDGTGMPLFCPDKESLLTVVQQNVPPLIRTGISQREYVILKAIALCNSALSGLSSEACEILNHERKRLSAALLAVCLSERGSQGPARFAECLAIVDTLERLAQRQKNINLLLTLNRKVTIRPPSLVEDLMECL